MMYVLLQVFSPNVRKLINSIISALRGEQSLEQTHVNQNGKSFMYKNMNNNSEYQIFIFVISTTIHK